jgi:hypothetical protein
MDRGRATESGPPEGRTGRETETEKRVRFDGAGRAPEEAPQAPGRTGWRSLRAPRDSGGGPLERVKTILDSPASRRRQDDEEGWVCEAQDAPRFAASPE